MRIRMSLLLMVCVFFLSIPAWAGSGAYRIEVPDAGAWGKGGAFVGEANTPAAVYYNPAGMTQLKKSSFSVGVSAIQPKVSYSPESGNKIQMKDDTFYIPNFYYVTNLGLERLAFGIGATSAWGLTTEWSQDVGVIRYSSTRSELQNQDYLLTMAYKVSDRFSIGGGVDIDKSKVDQQKNIYQDGTVGDANFRLKGDNTAAGVRLAALYKVNDQHQFGLIYRGAIEHKYKGKLYLDNLSPSVQAALAAMGYPVSAQYVFGGSSSFETGIVAKSTIPQSAVLGYSFKPNNKWLFNADLEWMDWGAIKKQEFGFTDTLPTALAEAVINSNGNPTKRDWHDSWTFDFGAQYNLTDRCRLRGGYFFHQTPIPAVTQDAGLPDSNSHSFTTGFGYDITKSLTLDFSWATMFFKTRTINSEVSSAYGGINGTYHEWVNLILVTATYSF